MGKVIYWNRDRLFGFIRCDDGGADQFVHVSALIMPIRSTWVMLFSLKSLATGEAVASAR
ncbi:cold-shock protein [Bradyrhizobium sp. CCGUVB23]|uniref:cold-shock protein n=1 Tax=Bradyrhizobium sp. CCGUVB23 TaxID=2949630 RepID=UPI003532142C